MHPSVRSWIFKKWCWGGSQHHSSLHPPADFLWVRGEIPGKRAAGGVSAAQWKRLSWSERWAVNHRLLLRHRPPVHRRVETVANRILEIFWAKDFTDSAQGALRSFSPGQLPVHESTAGMETWTGHRRHSGHGGVSPGQRHGAAPTVDLHKEDKSNRMDQKQRFLHAFSF